MTTDAQRRRSIAIAVVAPLWPEHFGTDLEIAAQHLADGYDVHVLVCEGNLAGCTARPVKDPVACIKCRYRLRAGLEAVGIPRRNVHVVPPSRPPSDHARFENLNELQSVDQEGSGAGRAAASSLVSYLRDPSPKIDDHRPLAEALLQAARSVHDWTTEVLTRHSIDRLYVFNGRFVTALPAVTAARSLGVDVVAHERNWNGTGFILRSSGSVHSLEEIGERLENAKLAVESDRATRSIALQWFEGRRFPITLTDPIQRFTVHQDRGQLPLGFNASARNVAVFVSSEDEFVALADWQHEFSDSQEAAIQAIAQHADLDPRVQFWVRVHPNLADLDNAQTERIARLEVAGFANLTVIDATSHVDSYALAEACELTIVFGSTIGAESIYWGTPCMLVGRATYERIDGIVAPGSVEEAVGHINAGVAFPPEGAALGFGALMTEADQYFGSYRPPGATGKDFFAGQSLVPDIPTRVKMRALRVGRRLTPFRR